MLLVGGMGLWVFGIGILLITAWYQAPYTLPEGWGGLARLRLCTRLYTFVHVAGAGVYTVCIGALQALFLVRGVALRGNRVESGRNGHARTPFSAVCCTVSVCT